MFSHNVEGLVYLVISLPFGKHLLCVKDSSTTPGTTFTWVCWNGGCINKLGSKRCCLLAVQSMLILVNYKWKL